MGHTQNKRCKFCGWFIDEIDKNISRVINEEKECYYEYKLICNNLECLNGETY